MRVRLFALSLLLAAGIARADLSAPPGTSEWLDLIDTGHYAESWSAAGSAFQAQVPQQVWVQEVGPVRTPLGAVKSRTLVSVDYPKSLPGAPDGEYAVVKFSTSFAAKAQTVETLVLTHEKDKWKTVGYFIK